MTKLMTVAALLVSLASVSPARAQEATNMPAGTSHSITLDAGLDSAMAAGLGYTYRLRPSFWSHDVLPYGKLTLPAGGADLSDSAVEAGIRTTAYAYGNLRLQVALGPVLRNTETRLFSASAVGAHTTFLAGYQSTRWGLMAELAYERMLATHLRQSDLYEDTFYADAESGWYSNTAGTIRAGLRTGVRLGDFQLSLRAGLVSTHGGTPHLAPIYGTIGVGYTL